VLRVLREPDCHQHPEAARLACRILPHREAAEPGAVFRTLFRLAKNGDPELLTEDESLRTRAAELAADPWSYRPDDPATHWVGAETPPKGCAPLPDVGREPPAVPVVLSPLERLQAAERAARLAALGPAPPPRTPSSSRTAVFLDGLSPALRATLERGPS
jgi:hypothetical protein